MKRFFIPCFFAAFLCVLIFSGCKGAGLSKLLSFREGQGTFGSAPAEGGFDKDTSYAMGMSFATNMKEGGLVLDTDEFLRGFKDVMQGAKTRYTPDEADMKIQFAIMARQEKENSELAEKENEFLAENSKKFGVTITGSGLQYEVISEGSGPKPVAADVVRVNYEGKLMDGTVFDSSYVRGEPVEFPLNGVIPGWTEGVQLMRTGSKYRFCIPSALAYGENGSGPIPPHSPLIFEIELLDIVK